MSASPSQVWAAAVLTAGAIAFVVDARALVFGSVTQPGPGFFPMCLAVALTFVSAGLLAQALRAGRGVPLGVPTGARPLGRVVATLLALLVYAFVLETLGFVVSTFLLIAFLFRAIEPQPWVVAMGGAAATAGVTHLVFRVWLRVQLPSGPWGF
jgi:hypothetical protein